MTQGGSSPRMAWDASALLHASRADRLDVLLFQVDAVAPNSGHVTTAAVAQEVIRRGGTLPWRAWTLSMWTDWTS